MLVGGLGLGNTAARLLRSRSTHRARRGTRRTADRLGARRRHEQLGALAGDARVELVCADIADTLAADSGGWDAILLDVDNGPSFLIHERNAQLYDTATLSHCLDLLSPGGQLVIWCESASPQWNTRCAAQLTGGRDRDTGQPRRAQLQLCALPRDPQTDRADRFATTAARRERTPRPDSPVRPSASIEQASTGTAAR